MNIKTIAGWIKVKRTEKNLTPGHLAAKMGIATVLVRSWESGASQPDSKQLQDLAKTFGVDEASIPNWEKNTYQPGERHMQAIVEWLGFDPRSPATSANEYVPFILPPSCCCCIWGFIVG